MPKDIDTKKEIEKINSSSLGRNLSLLGLTVASGTKFAGKKISNFFQGKKESPAAWQEFLADQANIFVKELGKLKGSIMKAGQMLSVYGEHFLPPEVNKILKELQSDSRPVVWSEMEKILLQGLGEKLKELKIDQKPIAAASMGQVYKATIIRTGEIIAIKVQYPGVDKAIDSDIKTLKRLISLTGFVSKNKGFDEIFKEVRMMLHYEVDYLREAETIALFQDLLKDDSRFIIPKVFLEYSTKKILAMSFEEGVCLDSKEVETLSQVRRNQLAYSFMELMYLEIFSFRMVQTDPHFGNYRIRLSDHNSKEDKIILYDFGAVRKFPKRYIEPFAAMVNSALDENEAGVLKAGRDLGFLFPNDTKEVNNLFCKICFTAVEGFKSQYESSSFDDPKGYPWHDTELLKRLTSLGKDAVFAFKLRPPPREAVFLDRKMIGVFTIVSHLRMQYGPRAMIKKYVESSSNDNQSI